MIVYDRFDIVFAEIPDEVSLAITLKNCPYRCEECHSPWLREKTGKELTLELLLEQITKYEDEITNVLFLGGDANLNCLIPYLNLCKNFGLKTSLYSGKDEINERLLDSLTYYKIGHYDKNLGGLNSKTTNQILYKIEDGKLENMTYKFWRK